MRLRLNLVTNADVTPERDWFTWFYENGEELEKLGESILSKYVLYLEPEIYGDIHHLIKGGAFISMMKKISDIRAYDSKYQVPRPTTLSRYYIISVEDDFTHIKHLCNWCNTNYIKLKKIQPNSNIYEDWKKSREESSNIPNKL